MVSFIQFLYLTSPAKRQAGRDPWYLLLTEDGSYAQKDAGVTEVRKYKASGSDSHIPAMTFHISSWPLNLALRK